MDSVDGVVTSGGVATIPAAGAPVPGAPVAGAPLTLGTLVAAGSSVSHSSSIEFMRKPARVPDWSDFKAALSDRIWLLEIVPFEQE